MLLKHALVLICCLLKITDTAADNGGQGNVLSSIKRLFNNSLNEITISKKIMATSGKYNGDR